VGGRAKPGQDELREAIFPSAPQDFSRRPCAFAAVMITRRQIRRLFSR
jgi:hypothetical protein